MSTPLLPKTTFRKAGEPRETWHFIDADGQIVGRLAARVAMVLMGKHRPDYTPHVDNGDYVVVVNCEKVKFTGNKWRDKVYRHHSGWIGGLKEEPALRVLARHPDRIFRKAVQRMLPKTLMGGRMLKKLKIYAGTEHPHAAQNPEGFPLK